MKFRIKKVVFKDNSVKYYVQKCIFFGFYINVKCETSLNDYLYLDDISNDISLYILKKLREKFFNQFKTKYRYGEYTKIKLDYFKSDKAAKYFIDILLHYKCKKKCISYENYPN
nr:MAG TPA: hypothetical protein [Crassvirales sp.]